MQDGESEILRITDELPGNASLRPVTLMSGLH